MIDIKLMTTEEVAEKLRCSRHYVTHLRKGNAFGGFKVGRRWMYKENEVMAYIDRALAAQENMNGRVNADAFTGSM